MTPLRDSPSPSVSTPLERKAGAKRDERGTDRALEPPSHVGAGRRRSDAFAQSGVEHHGGECGRHHRREHADRPRRRQRIGGENCGNDAVKKKNAFGLLTS